METKVNLSKKFTLQASDALRGAGLAALSSVLTLVYDLLAKGDLESINWKSVGISAVTVFIGYLIKNGLLEPTKIITTVAPEVNAEAVKAEIKQVV